MSINQNDVIFYVNEARTNPKKFAQYIQKEIDEFVDNNHLPLYQNCNYKTWQGKAAWIQCKQVLDSMKPLPPLQRSGALCLAAEDHAADMATTGIQGHVGSDGADLSTRINRRGHPVKAVNQVIASGENIGGDFMVHGRNHALNAVKGLLIDDGVAHRGHRKNILSQKYHYIGIGIRYVKDRIKVVMVFHSHDPGVKDNHLPSSVGTTGTYTHSVPNKNATNNPASNNNQIKAPNSNNSGNKVAVSTNTKTETSTVNGKVTTKTTLVTKYSDGSVQTKETVVTKG